MPHSYQNNIIEVLILVLMPNYLVCYISYVAHGLAWLFTCGF